MLRSSLSLFVLLAACGDDDDEIAPLAGRASTLEEGIRCATFAERQRHTPHDVARQTEPPTRPHAPHDVAVRFVVFENGDLHALSNAELRAQLSLLNDAFAGVAYFTLRSADRINDRRCSSFKAESACKRKARALHPVDGGAVLWIYTANLSAGLDGWATLPWSGAGLNDGVVIPVSDVPGEAAIHQVGHWLGIEACAASFSDDELARAGTMFTTYRL